MEANNPDTQKFRNFAVKESMEMQQTNILINMRKPMDHQINPISDDEDSTRKEYQVERLHLKNPVNYRGIKTSRGLSDTRLTFYFRTTKLLTYVI